MVDVENLPMALELIAWFLHASRAHSWSIGAVTGTDFMNGSPHQ